MPTTQMQTERSVISLGVNGSVLPDSTGWYHVFPEALPELWPIYRPFVLKVLERGDGCFAEHDILAMLLLGKWSLIATDRDGDTAAIGIIEIVDFPRKRVLLLKYAAGDMDAVLAGKAWLEGRGRALKCDAVQIYGRKGWKRLLPDWLEKWVVLEKDLNDGR